MSQISRTIKEEESMTSWQDYLNDHQSEYLEDLLEFLRIPSISSLPEHAGDVDKAADWVAARLETAGLEKVQVHRAGPVPLVYGEWLHAPDKPTIVIYGHFDTQPVDPIDVWTTPPFEPDVRENRVYARGSSDDKGNLFLSILAVEAMLRTMDALPVNVKFLFESEEEVGSPNLPGFISEHRDLLACDLVLCADGGQWSEDQPAILLGLRGLCALQVDIKGADGDVHSGTYGGTFMNPATALTHLISTLHDSEGRVGVAGFYDKVRSLSRTEKNQIEEIPYSESDYMEELGISALFGEPGFSTFERAWVRPTVEINGIWGGFQGEGVKTVIPSVAHAKISCRLVPDQDPEEVLEQVVKHIEGHSPPGVTVSVQTPESGAYPYLIPHDHPGNQAVRSVHKAVYGREPYYIRGGGSIPFCSLMERILGAYTVIFSFGLDDENAHAPDEFFRLESFRRGQKAYGMLLEELGGEGKVEG